MNNKNEHQESVEYFLKNEISDHEWIFSSPGGHGGETYFAHIDDRILFVKLGCDLATYRIMAYLGLSPLVIKEGNLDDGTTIMIQEYIYGRTPNLKDYHFYLENFARSISRFHHSSELKQSLPADGSIEFRHAGLKVLEGIQRKWDKFKVLVPDFSDFVDEEICKIREQVSQFQGDGLVASHNDICNSNWIITERGRLYLLDLNSMSIDDPALDIGATLWWYYPPTKRQEFLKIAGYAHDDEFTTRMRVRMAMHCLNIILPRDNSFDHFQPGSFEENLNDFKAIIQGKENPQGYNY